MEVKELREVILDLVTNVEKKRDCDVFLYFGSLERPLDDVVIEEVKNRDRRKNIFLILVTRGGEADASYRIARCFQEQYSNFQVYIPSYCKSAGTLLAIGAKELIISDHGELGPIDVQIYKKDELGEMSSGLDITHALSFLQRKVFSAQEYFLLELKNRSGGLITLKTALEISSRLATGLFKPIYEQIDPLSLGETSRAMLIAEEYGRRLLDHSSSLRPGKLERLVAHYPSHGFVIDKNEASSLFHKISDPTELEERLGDAMVRMSLHLSDARPTIGFASDRINMFFEAGEEDEEKDKDGKDEDKKNESKGDNDDDGKQLSGRSDEKSAKKTRRAAKSAGRSHSRGRKANPARRKR